MPSPLPSPLSPDPLPCQRKNLRPNCAWDGLLPALQKEWDDAIELWTAAAELEGPASAEAAHALGSAYKWGQGVAPDLVKAMGYYQVGWIGLGWVFPPREFERLVITNSSFLPYLSCHPPDHPSSP